MYGLSRWVYYKYMDELRYYGRGANAGVHIDAGDIEIIVDENGEIIDIAIYNASKHLSLEEIKKIAHIIEKPPQTTEKPIEHTRYAG